MTEITTLSLFSFQNSHGDEGAEADDDGDEGPVTGDAAEGAQHGLGARLHRRHVHPVPERQDRPGHLRGHRL